MKVRDKIKKHTEGSLVIQPYQIIRFISKAILVLSVVTFIVVVFFVASDNSKEDKIDLQARLEADFYTNIYGGKEEFDNSLPPRVESQESTSELPVAVAPLVSSSDKAVPLKREPLTPKVLDDTKGSDDSDFFVYKPKLDKPKAVFIEGAEYLQFPPEGETFMTLEGKIFYPLQQRYTPVTIKVAVNEFGVYLYGATLFEKELDGNVVLIPGVFMQLLPFKNANGSIVSSVEQELTKAIQISRELEFYPWARYATSQDGCNINTNDFRVSIQYGRTYSDVLISLAVPYTVDETNAVFNLADNSKNPCDGLELFFSVIDLSELLIRSLQAKTDFIR